ncbi:MAG: isoaspartyl peptidase/L-asparaginase [Saprospiraceae bacterium]|nr:isoaspartyl peptidase/L-asparaginase [Saprospiraceae bacterium]
MKKKFVPGQILKLHLGTINQIQTSRLPGFGFLCFILICSTVLGAQKKSTWAIAIHGGAGAISRQNMTVEKEAAYLKALEQALSIGEGVLQNGGTALDAVEQTIVFMEDCPLFNAGKGAVFNREGKVELDASIMDGATHSAGAAGGVQGIKNPIRLVRAIMEKSQHVFLVGEGAKAFGMEMRMDTADANWFYTEERWLQHLNTLQKLKTTNTGALQEDNERSLGTVGCVALDLRGNLAAGTSTGGMNNKRWNRLGDSPVIGAGTYADNRTCAVSCTGHGEYFIRYAVAHDLHARILYGKQKLHRAAETIIHKELKSIGAEGGLIAIDRFGNIATPFNSNGMYRAWSKRGEREIRIYNE